MAPAIPREGTVLVLDKLSPRIFGYKNGDVVVSKSMTGDYTVCKRIAAQPGDVVYADARQRRQIIIPPGHVWLLGDCHENSVDSRTYGPVPLAMLQGKVRLTLYPWLKWVESEKVV